MLSIEVCDHARQARDARVDGLFFTAVRSTGIYCRPVCPAPTPKRHNIHYFPSAAAAASAGYRPCLRCRPELSPDAFARGGEETVRRAVGAAHGRNPLPIVLPCHWVIGSDGSPTGFGGGLPLKQFLLEHEGARLTSLRL